MEYDVWYDKLKDEIVIGKDQDGFNYKIFGADYIEIMCCSSCVANHPRFEYMGEL